MKRFAILAALIAAPALAHPNGTYVIDNNVNATVTFAVVARCPQVDGALTGSLRALTFSKVATEAPYEFVTGNYVETHEGQQEVYVRTDEQCVPTDDGVRVPASRDTFDGYALRRI